MNRMKEMCVAQYVGHGNYTINGSHHYKDFFPGKLYYT